MTTQFSRLGFVTAGNPNHYDAAGLLLKELRKRATEEPVAHDALLDLESSFKEDYEVKLTEKEAVRKNMGDVIGDMLSDLAPEGIVFEIRKDSHGNSNYGYFVDGSTEDDDECDHEFHEDPEQDGVDVCIHCGEEA